MKMTKLVILVVAMATVDLPLAVRSHAGLFKLDFGHLQNEREILDADGNPTGTFPEKLTIGM